MNDPYVEDQVSSISRPEIDSSIENHKFSSHNGGNFIIGKHQHKILPIFSRKYTLDQGIQKLSPQDSPVNSIKSVHDISFHDDDVTLTPLPRRGILKNQFSEPVHINIIPDSPRSPKLERRTQSDTNFRSKIKYRIHFPNIKLKNDSSQEFVNPAFEPDDTVPKDIRFRDLVEHALQQRDDDNLHPYGRTNLYTTLFLGQKSNVETDGSKLAFWGILLLVILGITGGIIFMAEIHKLGSSHTTNTSNSSTMSG